MCHKILYNSFSYHLCVGLSPHKAFQEKDIHILHPKTNKKLKQMLCRILIPAQFPSLSLILAAF